MEQQNRRLVDAKRTAYQTADTASSTTKELYRQTEVLSKNKDRVNFSIFQSKLKRILVEGNGCRSPRFKHFDWLNAKENKEK